MKRLWLVVGSLAGIGVIVIVVMLLAPKPPIPGQVKSQFTSTLFVPQTSNAKIQRSTVKYDSNLKLLSFTAQVYGIPTVISEQPTPEQFTDIPQVYDKVLSNMHEFTDFDTDVGTVHITRPTDLGGKEAAVLNSKGTLFFAKPARDLSDDQWRQLFRNVVVVK
jgi:hypothetical protein